MQKVQYAEINLSRGISPVVEAGGKLPNLLLMMDTRIAIWATIDYQTMISCYFIVVLDTRTFCLGYYDQNAKNYQKN